ncbi:MAG: glycine zipper 2TM domain-containing protein [Sphingomonas sp.]|uniref:glycine zipper 2TM domain-containing protein n=1 Tax=Sphingomonas sp. TaxID=28214 RepID=UPI0025F0860C|nr:glycine zipper 2TM domain-containing protein [Sphingomonas sp.]MBX3566112.1 glycine zipper 2TM domain-containing protein [Sphingomonas sp.]
MRKMMLALGAITMAIPTSMVVPVAAAKAGAATTKSVAAFDQRRRGRHYSYREWRGRDGKRYCRRSDGTTGLVVGAVGGALVGRTIDTRGDRSGGTIIGAIAGGLAGREIDRSSSRNRCR